MLKKIIEKINCDYLTEARNSPTLIEDMAAMEKYMAESYSGRIFIELLQNADDCNSTHILVKEFNNDIIFANNGRPFDDSDIISISRSGSSKKERGTQIGYRGVGFKSASYLTSEIVIYSNETFFTFSKSKCANELAKHPDGIPTVRIPFLAENLDESTKKHVLDLVNSGFTTVFVFKNAKADQFCDEVKNLNNGYFIFLRNIENCKMSLHGIDTHYKMKRENLKEYKIISFEGIKKEDWLIVQKDNISLAFKLLNGMVTPCDKEESVYHCFLPTLDKSPFAMKFNADFSTDPSRKHITQDDLTDIAIDKILLLLFETIQTTLENKNHIFSKLFDIVLTTTSFNLVNQKLTSKLDQLIKTSLYINTNENKNVLVSSCKSIPDTFENSEKQFLRKKSNYISSKSLNHEYYEIFPFIDSFVSRYSKERFSSDEIARTLTEKDFVLHCAPQTYAKIISYVASSSRVFKMSNSEVFSSGNILIPTESGVISFKEVKNANIKAKKEVQQAIFDIVSETDVTLLCNNMGIKKEVISMPGVITQKFSSFDSNKIEVMASTKPVIAKWRSAEQQCMELEKHFGNTPIDVSRQNVGYDIESTMPSGEKKYIEVKLLSNSNGVFSITNNEYTAAHQYGEKYYICLILAKEKEAKVLYIKNPLESLRFEKRVRQWEWYCEKYSGEEFTIELK